MLKNYFTIAIRNLAKRKLYSFINIFGLAIGVAVCLVILRYVDFELSYDNTHTHAAQIYRTTHTTYHGADLRGSSMLSGYGEGPALLAEIPEVKSFARTHPMYGGAVVSYEPTTAPIMFRETNFLFVDSSFTHMFSFDTFRGDLMTALDDPSSIVITKKVATKYFGSEDPIGKTLVLSGGWLDGAYNVSAVMNDLPQNSTFQFEFLLPIHNLLLKPMYQEDTGWGWFNFITFVELYPNADLNTIAAKMPAFVSKYRAEEIAQSHDDITYHFQPLREIHLNPGLDDEPSPTTGRGTIYFFTLIAVFILAIAWVNYINLSTARAMERAREVGVKKSIGALRSQLIFQFLMESFVINFIGIVLAIAIAGMLLPVLGNIIGKTLVFDYGDVRLWLIIGSLFVLGSLVSGAYPAFVLSSFNTISVLKGNTEKIGGGFSLRKALVVFQFASSLILITGTFTIYRQMHYMQDQDKGLTMDQMLIVNGPSTVDRNSAHNKLIALKNDFKELPGVLAVATSASIPGAGHNWGTRLRREGALTEEDTDGKFVWVDPDFIDTYGMTLVAGKPFDPEIKSSMEAVIINEESLKAFGLGTAEEALNQRIVIDNADTATILGVLKNYNWRSLKESHEPMLLKADTLIGRNYSLHIKSTDMNQTIQSVEAKFKEAFPGNPFDYYFVDDFFSKQYKSEQQFEKIFSLFSGLAICIACLGLWGLAAFSTTQKLKEIGVRKVLGASVTSILRLLSWQFCKLVLIASLLALPLTWYGIDSWLGTFAFRIGIRWDLFVVPMVVLMAVALMTISIQIIRGARVNPATILRSE